jgi:hypothetical protein
MPNPFPTPIPTVLTPIPTPVPTPRPTPVPTSLQPSIPIPTPVSTPVPTPVPPPVAIPTPSLIPSSLPRPTPSPLFQSPTMTSTVPVSSPSINCPGARLPDPWTCDDITGIWIHPLSLVVNSTNDVLSVKGSVTIAGDLIATVPVLLDLVSPNSDNPSTFLVHGAVVVLHFYVYLTHKILGNLTISSPSSEIRIDNGTLIVVDGCAELNGKVVVNVTRLPLNKNITVRFPPHPQLFCELLRLLSHRS